MPTYKVTVYETCAHTYIVSAPNSKIAEQHGFKYWDNGIESNEISVLETFTSSEKQ